MSLGLGSVFVAVTTAANAGVPERQAGLAAALLNSSQQVGGALGISIFSAIATTRTKDLLGAGHPVPDALTGGFSRTLLVSQHLPAGRGGDRGADQADPAGGRAELDPGH